MSIVTLGALLAATPAVSDAADSTAAVPTATATAPGRIERYSPFASQFVDARDVQVWLPPGYDQSTQRYAVLYMHDGQNLFDGRTSISGQAWAVDQHLAALEAAGAVRPTIVVGIANTRNRWREYAPEAALSGLPQELRDSLARDSGGGPLADRYLTFLVKELKPYIDAHFRTRPGRDDTFVMGSSMGGLVSLYALLRYPEVFGAAGCLSTHWPVSTSREMLLAPDSVGSRMVADAYITWIDRHLPVAGNHRLYFDHGTVFLDALYAPHQRRVDAIGTAHGYRKDIDWMSREFPGATHDEAAWRERLDLPLRFLLR